MNDKFLHIIPRNIARSIGMKRFFITNPCRKGHIYEKRVSDGRCLKCAKENNKRFYDRNKEAMVERTRNYRDNHKDKCEESYKERLKRDKEYRTNRARALYNNDENNREIRKKGSIRWKRRNKSKMKEYWAKYYQLNADRLREAAKEYANSNKEKRKELFRKHYIENIEYHKQRANKYRIENWDRILENKKKNHKKRMKTDPEYRSYVAMRSILQRTIKQAKTKKDDKTVNMLGYSSKELFDHMQLLFDEGMTWLNHGEWHIDHIKPVSLFLEEGITDPKIINALDNLQPLWAEDNLSKSNKYKKPQH